MMVRMNDDFYFIDEILTNMVCINWLEIIGEDNYLNILKFGVDKVKIKEYISNMNII